MLLSTDIRILLQQAHNHNAAPEPVPARTIQGVRLRVGGWTVALMSAQGKNLLQRASTGTGR